MKWIKTKLIILFMMLLGIGIYFFIPSKVYAAEKYPTATDLVDILDEYGDEDSYIIVQFPPDYVIKSDTIFFVILIDPYEYYDYYEFNIGTDLDYFEPNLRSVILEWASLEFNYTFEYWVQAMLGINNFDGYLYWNPVVNYFQINQVDEELLAEFEYYRQRVAELESLIDDLNNQLDLEYDRGYDNGFIAGEKSKLAKNNEAFYNNIAIWIPAVISLVVLGSIAFKLRKQ